jgi:hypothetical protein
MSALTFLTHTCDGCGQHPEDCPCAPDRPPGMTQKAAKVYAGRLTLLRQIEVAYACAALRRIAALDAQMRTIRPHLSADDEATRQQAVALHEDQLAEAMTAVITGS